MSPPDMKTSLVSIRPHAAARMSLPKASGRALLLCTLTAWLPTQAQTPLADSPLFTPVSVPGNLALVLSVEYPTAISVAYTDTVYSSSTNYLGYFDPNKCYTYAYTPYTDSNNAPNPNSQPAMQNYFQPAAKVKDANHTCAGQPTSNLPGQWSGNFLNWVTMQTIDPFRWVLTGGYRVYEDAATTVLEKAWGSPQSTAKIFPDRSVTVSGDIVGATPLPSSATQVTLSVYSLGNRMRFSFGTKKTDAGDISNTPTAYNGIAHKAGVTYELFVRVKVCDPSLGIPLLESNCKAYPTSTTTNYKPEGLLQKYSNQLRYSAFGYLNDSNPLRDAGVMRARQKFVGPTQPVPGSAPVPNAPGASVGQTTAAEWDSSGVYIRNPDTADAANTSKASIMGAAAGTVQDSGVLNYLNKFGEAAQTYKSKDPVSELYYAAIRYFKFLPDVPDWYATGGANAATVQSWVDGFPVIPLPSAANKDPDPVLYSCQKNFILGIGDVNTHVDKNVPGNTSSIGEPNKPSAVVADTTVDAVAATNIIGNLEGLGNIGNLSNYNSYINDYNSAYIAGLAYDSHIHDIRGRTLAAGAKPQTIDTYWVDVQEGQIYKPNNQYYLAAKYGGFTVPSDWLTNPRPLTGDLLTSWYTSTRADPTSGQPYPDHYYSGGQPDAMQAGLNAAFTAFGNAGSQTSGSFATALPQVATTGNAYYTTSYNPPDWTGDVTGQALAFDASGVPTPQTPVSWTFSTNLAATLANSGWDKKRQVITWNSALPIPGGVPFRAAQIASQDLTALDTGYVSGSDSSNYLNYLRGDQSNEVGGTGTQAYRARTKLIGDIVDSQIVTVGAPSFPFSDATNLGYAMFKSTWANRRTMVYVGANDGMLHAINGALQKTAVTGSNLETDANAGQEMFAYVPEALFKGPTAASTDGLAALGNPQFVHHYMVDATPAVYDLDFKNAGGATSSGYEWHSLLVSGLGKGGKSYFAIDVTDPVQVTMCNSQPCANTTPYSESIYAGKVKWEFNTSHMGFTYGLPLITKTAKWGWVAILTSGYNNDDGKGYFFFVDPTSGKLLETVSTGAGSPTNDAGLAHANAFVVDSTNGTADSIYAGDLLGNLWRLDVTATSGAYPAPTQIAVLTGSDGSLQPVTSDPIIEVDPVTKQRIIMVGTGRLLAQADAGSKAPQSFYAFFDGTNASFKAATTVPVFPYTRSSLVAATTVTGQLPDSSKGGWYVDLGADAKTGIGWRVISDATTNAGSIAVPAVLPSGADPCQTTTGLGRAYALQYSNGLSVLGDKNQNTGLAVPYVSEPSPVTSLRYLSVNGKSVLAVSTSSSPISQININQSSPFPLRRLNWRELQSVD